MKIKTLKIIMTFVTFLLAFPFHFVYNKLPNFIFSIFFPVNESTWEHLKMIFTATLTFTFISDLIKHNKNNK